MPQRKLKNSNFIEPVFLKTGYRIFYLWNRYFPRNRFHKLNFFLFYLWHRFVLKNRFHKLYFFLFYLWHRFYFQNRFHKAYIKVFLSQIFRSEKHYQIREKGGKFGWSKIRSVLFRSLYSPDRSPLALLSRTVIKYFISICLI